MQKVNNSNQLRFSHTTKEQVITKREQYESLGHDRTDIYAEERYDLHLFRINASDLKKYTNCTTL